MKPAGVASNRRSTVTKYISLGYLVKSYLATKGKRAGRLLVLKSIFQEI
jgi:hypothetical protein